MARIVMKISKTDGTVLDNAAAEFDDEMLGHLIAACEALNLRDAEGSVMIGARSISYATRIYLTRLVEGYVPEKAAQLTREQISNIVKEQVDSIMIINNPE